MNTPHNWSYVGHGPIKNQHWYQCDRCGLRDWLMYPGPVVDWHAPCEGRMDQPRRPSHSPLDQARQSLDGIMALVTVGAANSRAMHDALGWAHEMHGVECGEPSRETLAIIEELRRLRKALEDAKQTARLAVKSHNIAEKQRVESLACAEKAEALLANCQKALLEALPNVPGSSYRARLALVGGVKP